MRLICLFMIVHLKASDKNNYCRHFKITKPVQILTTGTIVMVPLVAIYAHALI